MPAYPVTVKGVHVPSTRLPRELKPSAVMPCSPAVADGGTRTLTPLKAPFASDVTLTGVTPVLLVQSNRAQYSSCTGSRGMKCVPATVTMAPAAPLDGVTLSSAAVNLYDVLGA